MRITETDFENYQIRHPLRINEKKLKKTKDPVERKIYSATQDLPDGVKQTVGRYTVWKETKPGRRAVHWRDIVEEELGPDFVEEKLDETEATEQRYLVIRPREH